MADQSANGRVRDDSPESSEQSADSAGGDAVRSYGPWVKFFAFVHRYVSHCPVVFWGSGVVGALVLVRQFYAFASEPTEWSGLPSWTVIVGVVLFGFGVGYYVTRAATACSECETPFSRRRIDKRPVSKDSEGDRPDRMYLEETYECGNCGAETAELYSQSGGRYIRY